MRLQPLYDLQQEINRLFIAGSKFAKGDPRLQKQIPVFIKLGEKAPVFAKLANDIEELINTDSRQSAAKLTSISTLLYSILYTQGETLDTELDVREQEPLIHISDVNTDFSYLQLHPVIQALSTSNSGRLEILKDAKDRGIFSDSRTFQYLDYALADKYGELADYVEKVIIPAVGKPMIPFLRKNFQYADKTEHVRRLRLLDLFDCPDIPLMIEHILSESLPLLQSEAMVILAKDPSNEEIITKLAEDKNKTVREAAYRALAKLGTRNAMERLKDIYVKAKGKTQQLHTIVSVLASSKLPYFFGDIFTQVESAYEEFLALDKKTDEKILVEKLEKFGIMLEVLRNKNESVVDDFYIRILNDKKFFDLVTSKKALLSNITSNAMRSISRAMAARGDEQAIVFYERNIDHAVDSPWIEILWNSFFFAAERRKWAKEILFDRFYPAYKKGYLSINDLFRAFTDGNHSYYYYSQGNTTVYKDRIDLRWLEDLYNLFDPKKKWGNENHEALIILDACEVKPKRFHKLLESTLKYTQPATQISIFKYIIKHDLSDKFDIIFSAIEQYPKGGNYNYLFSHLSNTGFWTKFPEKYEKKFRKLHEKTKQDVFNEIADEIGGGKG
ncbi:MAG: HEAT repeat domain-containing protein [Tannerella sp.]|jgi:hypothetical protein|nr:HEAT repeat domain-containing protein [Tannerella sp.]